MSGTGNKMKLKLNTTQAAASTSNSLADSTPTPSASIKLNFGKQNQGSAGSPPPPQQQQQQQQQPLSLQTPKSAGKKAPASTNASPATATKDSAKKPKSTPGSAKPKIKAIRLNSHSGPSLGQRKPSIIKLGGSKAQPSPSTGNPRLRLKRKGQLPPRPAGAGYDSEAEDAEEDPAIEESFILRMPPGPDCEYVRQAIEDRKIGLSLAEGGADISMRMFSSRKAAVKVRGRIYAAVIVDLPCIVESMKSWDRKGWWKSADICQMMLVTKEVDNEDAARNAPLPSEVDENTWLWPHGLTPPMHNARKRRFRKRVSHRTIEQAEEEVERLLAEDEEAQKHGGTVRHQLLDWDQIRREEEGEDMEEDAEGDMEIDGYAPSQAIDDNEEDDEDWTAQFEARLGEDDNVETVESPATGAIVQPQAATTDSQAPTPADEDVEMANSSAQGDIPSDGHAQDSQPQTPANATTSSDEDDDEDEDEEDEDEDEDDDDDEDDEDVDDETRERLQQMSQQREEIIHLERQIAERREQLAKQSNPLLQAKLMATIKRFEEERDVKKRGLGVGDDDDDDDD